MRHVVAALMLAGSLVSPAVADETVVENGVTYRVTRRVEKTPVANVRLEERTETVYRTESVTQFRDEQRTVWVPVTEYSYQPRWNGWWNPFAPQPPSYELRPTLRWQQRTETVRVPVTVQQVVPETRIRQVPVRSLGFVDREIIERVAVRDAASSPQTLAPAVVVDRSQRPSLTNLSPIPSTDGRR